MELVILIYLSNKIKSYLPPNCFGNMNRIVLIMSKYRNSDLASEQKTNCLQHFSQSSRNPRMVKAILLINSSLWLSLFFLPFLLNSDCFDFCQNNITLSMDKKIICFYSKVIIKVTVFIQIPYTVLK